jgi:hypothetical protein
VGTAREEPPRPPYFLVYESSDEARSYPLTIAAAGRGAISLFTSAGRAREFLASTDFGPGWEPVQVSPEELVAALEAHRDLVEYVAHDPPPASESGAKVRLGKLADLSDALRERARSEMGLFDLGRPDLN